MTKKLLNIDEASGQLGMHPQTVRELLRWGYLADMKMSDPLGRWKAEPEAIDDSSSGTNTDRRSQSGGRPW